MKINNFSMFQYMLGAIAGSAGVALLDKGHFWGMVLNGAIFASISLWLDHKYERENA